MDTAPTQVFDDDEFAPTQKISCPKDDERIIQMGVLYIGLKSYPINRGINKIGRSPACNIVVNEQTISKQHAEIEVDTGQGSSWLCDLHSSNKTKLNNSILRPGRWYELKDGSAIDFGRVRAIYKMHCSMDDSIVPETPTLHRQKNQQAVIPGTPDSSMNNSSTLGNISVIPGTQGDQKELVFRCPSLPQSRKSKENRNFIEDSSLEDSADDSRNISTEENDGKTVSSYESKTGISLESRNEKNVDIHDVETQKISLEDIKRSGDVASTSKSSDIHEMETQQEDIHDLETQRNITDIHEMDTQEQLDAIYTVKTRKSFMNIQDAETQRNSDNDEKKRDIEETVANQEEDSIDAMETQKIETRNIDVRTSDTEMQKTLGDDNKKARINDKNHVADRSQKSEDAARWEVEVEESFPKNSQDFLKLSFAANYDEVCSVLDQSAVLLGSQNLLEKFINEEISVDESKPRASTSRVSLDEKDANETDGKDGNEASEKSTDDENIFDVATQKENDESIFDAATQRVSLKFENSLVNEDSETDEEGAFLRYSRNSQTSIDEKVTKKETNDDDDSDTDEEGRFVEIAIREKQRASTSFTVKQNESEGKMEPTTSHDSDDFFNLPTQRASFRGKHISNSTTSVGKMECKEENVEESKTKKATDNVEKNDKSKVKITNKDSEIDLAPTQILPSTEIVLPSSSSSDNTNEANWHRANEDITDMEDNSLTQIIVTNSTSSEDVSDGEYQLVNSNSPQHIDYEMAPTQLISDVDHVNKENSKPGSSKEHSSRSPASNKINLDDTMERNLNEMFDGVDEEQVAEEHSISTQSLKSMLQTTQEEAADNETECSTTRRSSPRATTSTTPTVNSNSHPVNKGTRASLAKNADVDSQDLEAQYFSKLTSKRKTNVFKDSQDVVDSVNNRASREKSKRESKTTNNNTPEGNSSMATEDRENKNTFNSPTRKSSTRVFTTPKSSKKNRNRESKVQETISEKVIPSPKKNDQTIAELSKIGDSDISSPRTNEWPSVVSRILAEEGDDDIMAGLPEVRISGTLSNPASPRSAMSNEFKIKVDYNVRSKRGKDIKKDTGRRRGRQLNHREIRDEEPYVLINSIPFVSPSEKVSNSLSVSLGVDEVPVKLNRNEETQGKSNRRNLRRKTMGDSLKPEINEKPPQQKPIPPIEPAEQSRKSLSLRSNRRTGNFSKENVDHSSVFQVEKEAPVERAEIKIERRKSVNPSRAGKRPLSSTGKDVEQVNAKKRKAESVNEVVTLRSTRSRRGSVKSASNTSQSTTILNYMTKRDSPVNENSNESSRSSNSLCKNAVINVVRMSPNDIMEFTSSESSQEEINGSSVNNIERNPTVRTDRQTSSNSVDLSSGEKNVQNVTARRSAREKKPRRSTKDISADVGEESQEVEMIMNKASMNEQSLRIEKNRNETVKESTRRTGRKHLYNKSNESSDNAIDSVSSDVCDSDNTMFEVPTSKPKRAKLSRTIAATNVDIQEPIKAKGGERSSRSSRANQRTINDSLPAESDDTFGSKKAPSKRRGKNTTKKNESKIKESDEMEIEDSSSATNSSMDSSIMSGSARSRRSLSSSFTSSNLPSKVKQKILFTGVANDYGKILTKLGASSVEDPAKCTVLVTDKVRRTVKFLCALAYSVPIVAVDWLLESGKAGRFIELENYTLKDPAAEAKFGFRLRGSLEKSREKKLLDGYTVVITPNVSAPPIPELKSIIISCGGKALVRPPNSWPEKAVIITYDGDLVNARKFLAKAPKTVTVQSTEFLLTGILRQELNFTKYKLI